MPGDEHRPGRTRGPWSTAPAPIAATPLRAGWWRRVTTGRPGRLFGALLAAVGGAWAVGSVAGALGVMWRDGGIAREQTLLDMGAVPIWMAITLVIFGAPLMLGCLAVHAALATLRLTRFWAYAGAGLAVGAWFTWDLVRSYTSCPPSMQGACPQDLAWAGGMLGVVTLNLTLGLAPILGAALSFWLVLRPDRAGP
jgi:hypothetical protein